MKSSYIESLLRYIANTNSIYSTLLKPDIPPIPIPYFGNIENAEILTVGVNPAVSEFKKNRNWPDNPGADHLESRLKNYFNLNSPPPHNWFNTWEDALNLLGSSYYCGMAAHVDLSPRATINMGAIREIDLFIDLIKNDMQWFYRVLPLCKKARLMLIAGTVTKKYYINEFLKRFSSNYGYEFSGTFKRTASRGQGKIAFHQLEGKDIHLPVFFCSTSPSANDKYLLIKRIEENAAELKRLISMP